MCGIGRAGTRGKTSITRRDSIAYVCPATVKVRSCKVG
jgi:hypothetical protein